MPLPKLWSKQAQRSQLPRQEQRHTNHSHQVSRYSYHDHWEQRGKMSQRNTWGSLRRLSSRYRIFYELVSVALQISPRYRVLRFERWRKTLLSTLKNILHTRVNSHGSITSGINTASYLVVFPTGGLMVETLGLGTNFAGAWWSAVGSFCEVGAGVDWLGGFGDCGGDECKEGDLGLHFVLRVWVLEKVVLGRSGCFEEGVVCGYEGVWCDGLKMRNSRDRKMVYIFENPKELSAGTGLSLFPRNPTQASILKASRWKLENSQFGITLFWISPLRSSRHLSKTQRSKSTRYPINTSPQNETLPIYPKTSACQRTSFMQKQSQNLPNMDVWISHPKNSWESEKFCKQNKNLGVIGYYTSMQPQVRFRSHKAL